MFANVVFERLDGIDPRGDAHIVINQGVFAGGQPELAFASLEPVQVFDHALVVGHEGKRACHLPEHHSLAPEYFGTFVRIHAGVIHSVTATNHKTPEAHFFDRFHKSAFLIPGRHEPATCAERFCHLHNPFGLDFGTLVQENAARFANFGAKDPFYTLTVKVTTREHMGFAPAHQAVATVFNVAAGNAPKESGKERDVQIVGMEAFEWAFTLVELDFENAAELVVQINPFAATQEMHAELVAEFAKLVPGFAIPFGAEGIPHANKSQKIALVARKFAVQLADSGAFRLFAGDNTRVLNAKGRADDERRLQNARFSSPQKHSRKRHVHREPRHFAAKLGHMTAGIVRSQRAEFKKRLVRAAECRMRRRLQEREVFQFQPEAAQLQNDVREITAPDFRLRKLVSLLEILRRIKSDTHTGLHASRSPRALSCARLRNFFDREPLDSRLRIVSRDAGHARIDHVRNSRNRE